MNMMTGRGAPPPGVPLAMPEQRFDRGRLQAHPAAPGLAARRAGVMGGTAGLTSFAGWEMAGALGIDGWQAPDLLALPVFLVLFARLALSACSFLAGALHRSVPSLHAGPLRSRTALLFPMHNEETARVFGTADAMREALLARGIAAHFDIFLLSDSTDPARQAREAEAARHRSRFHAGGVFYRRRTANAGRKAGNIADWVRRHGGAYEHFVILDADSVMEAATLHRLAAAMEADARAGLIQTLPTLVGGTTVFARMQQWAARMHGPAIARGLAAWHGEAGNYWGHNAIIRTRAFAEAAGLPTLPGRKPFGGEIMSHDFVEAALLRRAGWGVHIRPELGGSHESGPQTLGDAVKRDRRWCQGNLQHAALLRAAGLHPLSRLHLLDGILAYAASPLWLLLLVCAALQAALGLAQAGLGLLALTMALLLLPKLPGLREPGSALREFGLTTLLAPLGMVTQTRQILDILRGRDSGWAAQGREAAMPSWRQALREHAPHMAVGVLLLLPVFTAPQALPWLIPVSLPLLGAPGLARLVARESFGAPFRTPEEERPSPLLCRAAMLRCAWQLELREAPALALPVLPRPVLPAVAAEREAIAA